MLAALYKDKENLAVEQVPVPEISSREILLKVQTCSICGTDRKIYHKGHFKVEAGEELILGHEITGVIEKVGKDVDYYEEGMRIILAPNVGCGHCEVCRRGLDQLCPDYNAFGISWPGGFAEYVKIPEPAIQRGNLIEMPGDLSFVEGAVTEPVACCYNAYEAMDVKPGDSMLIFGAGPMGILHLVLNKFLGTGDCIMVDIDRTRLELAGDYGADYLLQNDDSLKENVMEITGGKGVDNIITAASVPVIQEQALELIAINGNISYFAGLPGDTEIKFNSNTVHYKQLRVTGTTGASLKQFRRVVRLARDLNLDKVVTERIKLRELDEVFKDPTVFKNNVKILVDMTQED